jgi:tRNA (mo5U34)-methyltransferase
MGDFVADRSLAELVAGSSWYQSMALPGGMVTPGNFDTLDELTRVPFSGSLEGLRCVDVGTADGFWAFEMERRGAGEVVAVDVHDPQRLDWPGLPKRDEMRTVGRPALDKHRGFEIAHDALGSSVQLRELSVYELTADVVGQFDFVFMGSLLLHLRDPVAALAAVRSVLRGELLSVDAISPLLTILHPTQPIARFEAPSWPLWWVLNLVAYRRLFAATGLETIDAGRPFFVKPGPGFPGGTARARRWLLGRLQPVVAARHGVVHAWVRARPITA